MSTIDPDDSQALPLTVVALCKQTLYYMVRYIESLFDNSKYLKKKRSKESTVLKVGNLRDNEAAIYLAAQLFSKIHIISLSYRLSIHTLHPVC